MASAMRCFVFAPAPIILLFLDEAHTHTQTDTYQPAISDVSFSSGRVLFLTSQCTMLQKLSKCEVEA